MKQTLLGFLIATMLLTGCAVDSTATFHGTFLRNDSEGNRRLMIFKDSRGNEVKMVTGNSYHASQVEVGQKYTVEYYTQRSGTHDKYEVWRIDVYNDALEGGGK